jgi:hypothetical protein
MRLRIVAGMLALAVSAALTPANVTGTCPRSSDTVTAWATYVGDSPCLASEFYCICQCQWDAMRRIHTETQT